MNDHIIKTQRAYLDLVEHLVPMSDELNDWLPTLRDVAPAQLDELRALGPRANWSAEPYAGGGRHFTSPNAAACSSRSTWPNIFPPPTSPNGWVPSAGRCWTL